MPDLSGAPVDEKPKRELSLRLKTGRLPTEGILWGLRTPLRFTLENPLTEIEAKYWEWRNVDWRTLCFGSIISKLAQPIANLQTLPSRQWPW